MEIISAVRVTPKIDPDFKLLCRKLNPEERSLLKMSIIEDGCIDPILLWNGFIVDGHNRFEICTLDDIPYRTASLSFESKEEVMLWMINHQMGRRNLSDLDKVQLLERKRPILEKQAKERQGARTDLKQNILANLPKCEKINIREDLAKEAGISGNTYTALKTVNDKGSEELKDAVREKQIGATTAAKIAVLPTTDQKEYLDKAIEKKKENKPTPQVRLTKEERENIPCNAGQYVGFAKCQIEKIQKGDKTAVAAITEFITWLENFRGRL